MICCKFAFYLSLTYIRDMIQQMHEQHVEVGVDVDVNFTWFHGLLNMAYIH